MPQLLLRGLTREQVTRVRDYARARGLSTPDGATLLLEAGLRAHERAVAAGKARAASMTDDERQHVRRAGGVARQRQIRAAKDV